MGFASIKIVSLRCVFLYIECVILPMCRHMHIAEICGGPTLAHWQERHCEQWRHFEKTQCDTVVMQISAMCLLNLPAQCSQ